MNLLGYLFIMPNKLFFPNSFSFDMFSMSLDQFHPFKFTYFRVLFQDPVDHLGL
jgi:hypothetical protein